MSKNQILIRNFLAVGFLISAIALTLEIFGVIALSQYLGFAAPPPCNNNYRVYRSSGGGVETTRADARAWVNRFNGDPSRINILRNGCFFSKQAIDQMFCNDAYATGIVINLGEKPDGSFTYIISLNECDYNIITADLGSRTNIFNSVTYCPPNCNLSPF
jgi:hypothetical protein